MTWLASTPAEVDLEQARIEAQVKYDDAAAVRILEHAAKIYRELRSMQSPHRARRIRANAVTRVCGVVMSAGFLEKLDELIGDPAEDPLERVRRMNPGEKEG